MKLSGSWSDKVSLTVAMLHASTLTLVQLSMPQYPLARGDMEVFDPSHAMSEEIAQNSGRQFNFQSRHQRFDTNAYPDKNSKRGSHAKSGPSHAGKHL